MPTSPLAFRRPFGLAASAAGLMLLSTGFANAEERRQLGAHEHGRGVLGIALDGNILGMDFRAPGADIVGFETEAETDAQKKALADAKDKLRNPAGLFRLPEGAGCQLESSFVHYTKDPEHAEHHAEHHGDDKGHDGHHHGEHHGDHHAGHHGGKKGHHDGHHEDHPGHQPGHAEFHSGYSFTCSAPEKLTTVGFPYFKAFERAQSLEVNVVTASTQKSFEANRQSMEIDLGTMN